MLSVMMNVTAIILLQNKNKLTPIIRHGRHVHFFIYSLYVQSNQQEVHRIETIRQKRLEEEECMVIELKQDKAIETYVTKERQYIDNLHIYLFIIIRSSIEKI